MPVHKIKGGYQWGSQKKYYGKDAKTKATKQGQAIKISEHKRGKI